jgi:hypothetical protein
MVSADAVQKKEFANLNALSFPPSEKKERTNSSHLLDINSRADIGGTVASSVLCDLALGVDMLKRIALGDVEFFQNAGRPGPSEQYTLYQSK